MQVTICVATRNREQQLSRLLESLCDQRTPTFPGTRIALHVVDNDPAGSAATVVRAIADERRRHVSYTHELGSGLARVRNTQVRATIDADAVAFIDDDELPSDLWLDELLKVRHDWNADAVGGPVLSVLPPEAPAWLREGRFLNTPRVRPRTGTDMSELALGNVLVTRAALDAIPGPFDARFGTLGGEDSMYFRSLHHKGFRLVWADDAIVHEAVPPDRTRLTWTLRRGFREGAIVMRRSRILRERHLLLETVFALGVVTVGTGALVRGLVGAKSVVAVAGARRAAEGLGRLVALFGRHPEPYA